MESGGAEHRDAVSAPQEAAGPQVVPDELLTRTVAEGDSAASSSVVAPPVAAKGVCPVKVEYLRQAPPRVSLDGEGRTRGMNKPADREHPEAVAGTERPTLEGEQNFFNGETLQRIKAALRRCKGLNSRGNDGSEKGGSKSAAEAMPESGVKREREEEKKEPGQDAQPQTTTPAAQADVTVEGTKVSSQALPQTSSGERLRELVERQREKSRGLFTDKLILAPLTTVGNLPFRRVCKTYGADVTVSEMALVFNLNRTQKSEWTLLRRHESEDIFGIQVAVSRANEAAMFAQALEDSGFSYDFVDINCGCPVEKVVKSGCGCGLWERKNRLREVTEALAMNQSRPVSIKCRIGPDEAAPSLHRQIHEYASWGASAVTVHGRSRKQRYTKLAKWDYVGQCASLTSLPIIGNGDILALEDVQQHRQAQPNVTSFMIGRGALIKPWIFEEIKSGQVKDISSTERLDMLKEFCRCGLAHWGADERGVMTTRRYLCEWLSFLCRYVPVALLERLPQRMNERPPPYQGRDDLETLMASDSVADWIRISELLLGPVEEKFHFTPKHKSNSYANVEGGAPESVEG